MHVDTFIGKRRAGQITLKVTGGKVWSGRRGKMRMRIEQTPQLNLEGERIKFTATIYNRRITGTVGTVAAAIEAMEAVYLERLGKQRRES